MTSTPVTFLPLGIADAPDASKPLLERVQRTFGFVPNLFGVFAASPALLEGYMNLDAAYERAALSPVERQVVLLAVSVQNECRYCTAAHSTVLKSFLKVSPEVVAAIRSGATTADPKLDALAALARELVARRGHASTETVNRFLAVGYAEAQVLEVLIGVALKTISNYTHHISQVALDQVFQPEA